MLDITQTTHFATPSQITTSPSLAELIVIARDAYRAARSTVIEHALVAGRALNEMEDRRLVPHGDWASKVYPQCEFGERQAQRCIARSSPGSLMQMRLVSRI